MKDNGTVVAKKITCPRCQGSGLEPGKNQDCMQCGGSGEYEIN